MEFYYINSKNKKIDFMCFPYLAKNIDSLLNYEWVVSSKNNKIMGFSRNLSYVPFEINVVADTMEEYAQYSNTLFETFDIDVANKTPGKLYYNGFYIACYIMSNRKGDWAHQVSCSTRTLQIVTDVPFWQQEEQFIFLANVEGIEEEQNDDVYQGELESATQSDPTFPMDVPFDLHSTYKPKDKKYLFEFPFDLKNKVGAKAFVNEHYSESDFSMFIFGPILNPQCYINSHLYLFNVNLNDGEYLEVNSRTKTIVKYALNGYQENCFNKRNKESDVFQKILPGRNTFKWSATFSIKLTVYHERSEPVWIV